MEDTNREKKPDFVGNNRKDFPGLQESAFGYCLVNHDFQMDREFSIV
jgi:hypothetical protein